MTETSSFLAMKMLSRRNRKKMQKIAQKFCKSKSIPRKFNFETLKSYNVYASF